MAFLRQRLASVPPGAPQRHPLAPTPRPRLFLRRQGSAAAPPERPGAGGARCGQAVQERAAGVPWGEGLGKGGFWKAGGERFQRPLPSSMRMRFHRERLVPNTPPSPRPSSSHFFCTLLRATLLHQKFPHWSLYLTWRQARSSPLQRRRGHDGKEWPHEGKTTPAERRKHAMDKEIGAAAGRIWQYLAEHGEATLRQLQRGTTLPDRLLQMGVGWLAREAKLRFVQERGV